MVFAGRREPPTDLDAGGHAKGPVLWGRGRRAERRGEDEKAVGVVCHQGKMEEEPAAAPWSQVREDLRTAHGRPGGQAGQRMTGMREAPEPTRAVGNNLSGYLGSPRGPRADSLLELLEEITSPSPQAPAWSRPRRGSSPREARI